MKQLLLLIGLFIFGNDVVAQYKGQARLQYGNDLSIPSGFFGFNISGEYFPVDRISVAPSISALVPATGKASNLHLDARYYFTEEKIQLYALLGVANFRRTPEFQPEVGPTNTGTLNIGGGVVYRFLEELGINVEIKYQPQNSHEVVCKVGIAYFVN